MWMQCQMIKKLLLIVLLIVGCATKSTETTTTITLNTDEIKTECKIECKKFALSSNQWCDCMHQCSSNRLKIVPFINRIYVEECWTDSTKYNILDNIEIEF